MLQGKEGGLVFLQSLLTLKEGCRPFNFHLQFVGYCHSHNSESFEQSLYSESFSRFSEDPRPFFRLKGEWLYSQGKGRHFKPGEHEAAVEYLNRNFPSPKIGRSVTGINENEEERLEKVLRMSKMHHSVPPLNFGNYAQTHLTCFFLRRRLHTTNTEGG